MATDIKDLTTRVPDSTNWIATQQTAGVGGKMLATLDNICRVGATANRAVTISVGTGISIGLTIEQTTTSTGARMVIKNDTGDSVEYVTPQSTSSLAGFCYINVPAGKGFRLDQGGSNRIVDINASREIGFGGLAASGFLASFYDAVQISRSGTGVDLRVETTDTNSVNLELKCNSGASGYHSFTSDSSGQFTIFDHLLSVNVMRIDAAGDVKFGAGNPSAKIDVDGNVLIGGDADQIQLRIKGHSSQTASIQEWQKSDSSVVASLSETTFIMNGSVQVRAPSGNPSLVFGEVGTQRAAILYEITGHEVHIQTENVASASTSRIRIAGEKDPTEIGFGGASASGSVAKFYGRVGVDGAFIVEPSSGNPEASLAEGSSTRFRMVYDIGAHVIRIQTDNLAGSDTDRIRIKGEQDAFEMGLGGNERSGIAVAIHGDIGFETAGKGLAQGSIYAYEVNDTISITGTGIGNKVQIDSFAVNGPANRTSPDHTNDHIEIDEDGTYDVEISLSIESAGASAYTMSFGLFKNNGGTEFQGVHASRRLAGGGADVGSMSLSGQVSVSDGDTLELWAWNETNTNDVIVDSVNLKITQATG